jgi:hypothetical protein
LAQILLLPYWLVFLQVFGASFGDGSHHLCVSSGNSV